MQVCDCLLQSRFENLVWKIAASSRSLLVLKINHVPIVEAFSCGGLILGSHLYIWEGVEISSKTQVQLQKNHASIVEGLNCRSNIDKQHLYVWEGMWFIAFLTFIAHVVGLLSNHICIFRQVRNSPYI